MQYNSFGENRLPVGLLARWVGLGLTALCLAVPGARATAQEPAQPGEPPQVHLVQQGETLWDLARLYFGDPFLWPEIYRINTTVVEDPHWIFPGEELRLAVADAVAVDQPAPELQAEPLEGDEQTVDRPVDLPAAPPPPPPAEEGGPTVFAPQRAVVRSSVAVGPTEVHRAVRRGDFYSSGFLTEKAELPWAEVLGRAEGGREDRIGGATAMPFGMVALRAPVGATYHVGDSVLTARIGREIPDWGHVVLPTGLGRVVRVAGREVEVEMLQLYDRVTGRQVAMPLEPFRAPGTGRPREVGDGMTGTIITARGRNTIPNQQDIYFLDRGREDGLVPGDLFEVVRPASMTDAPPERVGLLQIVHVRDRSASGLLVQVQAQEVGAGAPVRLIAKMPS